MKFPIPDGALRPVEIRRDAGQAGSGEAVRLRGAAFWGPHMSVERAFCTNKEHLSAFRAYGLPENALAKGSATSAVSIASESGPIRNFTSPEGHELGRKLAAWCDNAEPAARLVEPAIPPRCASCAFRAGNHLANGSPATQMDALKSVIERTPFECHDVHRPGDLCSGWLMMTLAHGDNQPGKAPWDFIGGVEP